MKLIKCVNCRCDVEYEIIDTEYNYSDNELSFKYKAKKAICNNCGNEIMIDEIEDYNQIQFEEEYRKINEIITKKEIEQILEKYNIGKRPLSLLLGFGEITITRYLNNYVPTKKNSLLLKKVLYEPEGYYSILMTNRKNIKEAAYKKSLKAVLKLIDEKNIEDNSIYAVTEYIISKLDVTPKALQKFLYYIQVFSLKFLGYPAFTSSCKKWAHGPVFGKIYYQYKDNGYNVIKPNNTCEINIDKDLLVICDAVIKYFGCYSADVLESFTHEEKPWNNTIDNEIIEKELIKEFAFEICQEHDINLLSDISKYSKFMFDKYQCRLFS